MHELVYRCLASDNFNCHTRRGVNWHVVKPLLDWPNAMLHSACSHLASVDLSTKVVDGMHKLEQTLCHELCHVASWVVDKVRQRLALHTTHWTLCHEVGHVEFWMVV